MRRKVAKTDPQFEREKLELESSLIEELKKQESLKEEILADLNPSGRAYRLLQHPAALLILGFFLTSGLGAGISFYWQYEEWVRQQSLLARKHALEQKYELANDIAKAIGETHAAASGVLSAIMITGDEGVSPEELTERTKYWYEVKRNWLINSDIYLQKLTVHFPVDPEGSKDKDKEARAIFENVIVARKKVNNKILNLLKDLENNGGQRTPEMSQTAKSIVEELNSTKQGEAKQLMEAVAAKIREEANLR